MKAIKQIIRGCGTLPHVGPHPGTFVLIVMTAIGFLGGISTGISMFLFFGAVYLYGAHERAKLSDELVDQ